MATLRRLRTLQMGLHTSGADWTTEPVTKKFVAPESAEVRTEFGHIERPFERGDGQGLAKLQGARVTQLQNLLVPVRGINGGAGNGTKTNAMTKMNIAAEMLVAVTGRDAQDFTGATAHASAAGDESELILAAPPVDLVAGAPVLIKCSDGKYHARFITAVDGASLSLSHKLRSSTNAQVTPTAGEEVYAGALFATNEANGDHKHLFADAEDALGRRKLYGLLGNATFQVAAGNVLKMAMNLEGTTWDNPAKASPSYSAPTQGDHLKIVNCQLMLDDDAYMARDFAFDWGFRPEARLADDAPAGHWGFFGDFGEPTLTFRLHAGTITAPKEVTDAYLVETLMGEGTRNLLFQIGRSPGGAGVLWIPAADIRATVVDEGAGKYINVTAIARAPDDGLDGMVRFGVF